MTRTNNAELPVSLVMCMSQDCGRNPEKNTPQKDGELAKRHMEVVIAKYICFILNIYMYTYVFIYRHKYKILDMIMN